MSPDQDPMSVLRIDVKERLENPLDAVIEPEIGREFGILVSEDDFSASGALEYTPPSVGGKEIDLKEIMDGLAEAEKLVAQAAAERDSAKRATQRTDRRG